MFDKGKITQNVFGFYLGDMDEGSSLQIGSYSSKYMRDPSELVWLDLEYNYFWYSTSTAFRIGDTEGYAYAD